MAGQYDSGTPTLQVNVYEHGHLVTTVACESAGEAADVVAQWEEQEGIECEVEDLSIRHGGADVLSPEPEDVLAEDEYRSSGR
jgi:hypothetical protein